MSEKKKAAILAGLDYMIGPETSRDEVRKIYDGLAETYDENAQTIGAQWTISGAQELRSVLADSKDVRILDLGAGTGLLGLELQKFGFTNIDALDANHNMLAKAQKKGIYKNIICAELGPNRLDINDDIYDALVSTAAIWPHHVDHTCLEELIRITKPGGFIVLAKSTPEAMNGYNPEFADEFEPTIRRLQDNKLWKLIRRSDIVDFYKSDPGYAYVLQVTA